jgi:hypothetical protein
MESGDYMKLENKYLKCFDKNKSDTLNQSGFEFLFQKNGVYYHKNNENIVAKFSNTDILKDTKFSTWIGL